MTCKKVTNIKFKIVIINCLNSLFGQPDIFLKSNSYVSVKALYSIYPSS